MKLKAKICIALLTAAVLLPTALQGADTNPETTYPVAILSFSERGAGMKGQGENVRDLLFVHLVENPSILLVERNDLDKILSEAELNLSGAIASNQAIQIGRLTGARILITGSVFKIQQKTYLVAKIIGTETGKVFGKSVNGVEDLDILALKLAQSVGKSLTQSASQLVAAPQDRSQRLEQLRKQLKGKKLPKIYVNIPEHHVGGKKVDPAAETEIIYLYKALGGEVVDKDRGDPSTATYRITGEGFSEFATRIRNLVSVKARLEIKILDNNGNITAIDRQTTVKVDLNEMLAGKTALQEAAQLIAERILPKLGK